MSNTRSARALRSSRDTKILSMAFVAMELTALHTDSGQVSRSIIIRETDPAAKVPVSESRSRRILPKRVAIECLF